MTTIATPNSTVIHGTHRPEDLLPAFIGVLAGLDPDGWQVISNAIFSSGLNPTEPDEGQFAAYVALASVQNVGELPPTSELSDEGRSMVNDLLFEELWDALNRCAPDGFYFGCHPGDGSDFGFWKSDEED